ncbi:siroheme synthase CysG [Bradyrhizobium sp. LHD-71]|uniref:siroheme synthase CysG n=1 Tax=Bradyrhizobium sp. LHD-71 TaxID=3072141 RepID=UPI00280D7FE6|nr:siroheme synthase CysG [Bradyrhizobium sp. LHD-71]MDQ8727052.1 siroheme synthase CysG [Bradyrhizobium sp. LHD-71]
MRFLPVFLDLRAGPIILVGDGELALAKLRVLTAAGAHIRWYATDKSISPSDRLAALGADAARQVEILLDDPLAADLHGAIAVLSAGAGEIGPAVSAWARAHGIPVNVMDDLAHSTFISPAIVDRGDVIVAVGTNGTSPVVARRLRERIEAMLPARIGDLAGFIGQRRKEFHARIADFPLRRRFWERVIDGPIGELVLAGKTREAEAALEAIDNPSAFAEGPAKGFVTLVGAGPGDPDLLTIKALRALQDADVVFYDELVSPEILDRVRRDASRVLVGRRIGNPGIGQDAINHFLIEAAQSGKRAVRLKGGDPFIFGRGGEEIEVLRKAGVAYAVVPGITAGIGAAAASEVPLTFRHEALRITLLTAHKAKDAEVVDWSALTDTKMTVVVYMGMTAAPAIRAGLLAAGRPPQTPVGVFARATRPDAKSVVGTLDELPALAAQVDRGPAILIIGDVVAHSAPWRDAGLKHLLSTLEMAAE